LCYRRSRKRIIVRFGPGSPRGRRVDSFPEFARLAADGRFTVPIARTFPLDDWRPAMAASLGGKARGKLLLLP
jgi:NADPH:quinone reductase-like Zn-dependent oxidoreductase